MIDFRTGAEIVSSALGLTSTYLLTKGDGRGWAVGALMAVLCAYVFFKVKLYGSFAIQLLFLGIQLTGLWRWKRGVNEDLRASSRRMEWSQVLTLLVVWSVTAAVSGYLYQSFGGRLPYLDGFATTGNILAQLALMAGFPECWVIYMITNAGYIASTYRSELYVYTALYSVYMLVAYSGWRRWNSKSSKPV